MNAACLLLPLNCRRAVSFLNFAHKLFVSSTGSQTSRLTNSSTPTNQPTAKTHNISEHSTICCHTGPALQQVSLLPVVVFFLVYLLMSRFVHIAGLQFSSRAKFGRLDGFLNVNDIDLARSVAHCCLFALDFNRRSQSVSRPVFCSSSMRFPTAASAAPPPPSSLYLLGHNFFGLSTGSRAH